MISPSGLDKPKLAHTPSHKMKSYKGSIFCHITNEKLIYGI